MSTIKCTTCTACAKEPNTHSFTHFGKMGESNLFYTAPARANPSETCEMRLVNFKHHIDTAKGSPWIWVFDFGHMESKHHAGLQFILGLAKIILNEHEDSIQHIYLLRINPWAMLILNMLQTVFTSGIFSRVKCIEGDTLELYMNLTKEFQGKPLIWLGKTVTLTPDKPLP